MTGRRLPTAAFVPFTLSPKGFFGRKTITAEKLGGCLQTMEGRGIEEMLAGYRDLEDLEVLCRRLVR